jgi:hypothetical protein
MVGMCSVSRRRNLRPRKRPHLFFFTASMQRVTCITYLHDTVIFSVELALDLL